MRPNLSVLRRIMFVLYDAQRCKTFSLLLKKQYNKLTEYRAFADAIEKLHIDKPQLIVCDPFATGQMNEGLGFIREVREMQPSLKILILSESYSELFIYEAFRAGADGYVLTSSGLSYFVNAIDEVLDGGAPMSREVAVTLTNSFKTSSANPLSRREQDVLREICTGKGYAYIAKTLNISPDTVKSHVQHIFQKLNVQNKSELVIKAKELKLV